MVEIGPGTLAFSQIQTLGDLLYRECRLLPQTGRRRQPGRRALLPGDQVGLGPLQVRQFLRNEPVSPSLRGVVEASH